MRSGKKQASRISRKAMKEIDQVENIDWLRDGDGVKA
jgi:hypothetical protein